MGSKGRPYRAVLVEGFEVLVGRGDEENDVLTFEIAAPEDFWLHVAGGVQACRVAHPQRVLDRAGGLWAQVEAEGQFEGAGHAGTIANAGGLRLAKRPRSACGPQSRRRRSVASPTS